MRVRESWGRIENNCYLFHIRGLRARERANKHTKRRTEACDDASLELQNDFVYNDFFLRSLLEWIVECGFGT